MEARDIARKIKPAKFVPAPILEKLLAKKKPWVQCEVSGIKGINGAETSGFLVVCPATAHMLSTRPAEDSYNMISDAIALCEREGAEIVGLGAFTAVAGDGGVTVEKRANIPVTTGNSYTVATAIEGTLKACDLVGINRSEAVLAVVGASGSIGRTCSQIMAPEFSRTLLVGRDAARTEAAAEGVMRGEATTDISRVKEADVIVTVTSADTAVIEPDHLKVGAVVCDVARPRDVSQRVAKTRPDVLVIEGGVVKVPGKPDFGVDFGFPPGTAYACMSETFMLAMEDRLESFTIGKDVSIEQVKETQEMAARLGFELEGFRAFEKAVEEESILRTKAARLQPA